MATFTPVDNDPFAAPAAAPAGPKLTPVDHDPFATSTAPAATPDLGSTAIWNKPADASWNDYLMAHLAKPFQGAGQAADDYVRTMTDAGSFGLADRAAAYMGGTNLADERAKTNAAYGRLGPVMGTVSSMIGSAPYAEIGLGTSIGAKAAPYVGRFLGGAAGGAAEGAAMGAAGAAGHGEGIGQGALVGGALGAAGGALPGGSGGRGGELTPPVAADDLHAAATAAYKPLNNILFDGKSEVHPALDAAENAIANSTDLTGQQRDIAKSTMAVVDNLRGKPQISASDIQSAQKQLGKIAGRPTATDEDKLLAPKFSAALEDVMQNGLPQTGVPLNTTATGYAAQVRDAGDVFHGMAQDTDRLDSWIKASGVKGSGPDVGAQAGSYLLSKDGQTYTKPGSPAYDALNALSATQQKPLAANGQGLTMWDLKHHLLWPAVGLAGAQAASSLASAEAPGQHSPWLALPEDAAGLVAGFALKKGLGRMGALAQQRAIDAARSTLSTGQFNAPVLPNAPISDMVRRAIYGRGAAGGF